MKVGSEVICIDDSCGSNNDFVYEEWPVKGRTYTVRTIYPGRANFRANGCEDYSEGILLEELVNPVDPLHVYKRELGFASRRFREVNPPVSESQEEEIAQPIMATANEE